MSSYTVRMFVEGLEKICSLKFEFGKVKNSVSKICL